MEPWLESFAQANFRRSSDTAHDLKTPLNVAVLNLELLRMRVRKIASDDDEKLDGYVAAIDAELRKLARIFDVFFLLSTPPKSEGEPGEVDIAALTTEAASSSGFSVDTTAPVLVKAHESRIRKAIKLFFEGAAKLLREDGRGTSVGLDGDGYQLTVTGFCAVPDLELSKVFKFYYTGPDGQPDLSLATARLIAETYGGELLVREESDKVTLRLSVPTR